MWRRQTWTTLLAGAAIFVITETHAQKVDEIKAGRKEFIEGFGGPPMGKDGFMGGINPLPRPQGLRDLGDIGESSPNGIFDDANYSFNLPNHITGSAKAPKSPPTSSDSKGELYPGVRHPHNTNYLKVTQSHKAKSKHPPRSTTYSHPAAAYHRPESHYNPYGGNRRPQRPHHQPVRYPRPSAPVKTKGSRPTYTKGKVPRPTYNKGKGPRTSASAKTKGGWIRPAPRHQQQHYRPHPPTYNNRPKYHNNRIKRRRPARISIG